MRRGGTYGTTNFVDQLSWTEHGFTLVYHDIVYDVTGIGVSSGNTFVASGGTSGTVMGSFVNSQWIGTTTQQLKDRTEHWFLCNL